MNSSGSNLLFGAIPKELRPSKAERKELGDYLETLTERVAGSRPVVCLLSNDEQLRQLNRDFLGHDYATDVLSFPTSGLRPELGEIVISMGRAAAQANEYGHSCLEEVRILMLHGVLHLAGFDHEGDGGRMARAEKKWRVALGLPETLIARVGRPRDVAGRRKRGAA